MATKKEVKKESESLKDLLKEIASILEWFDAQEELDVELALQKIKQAADFIKRSKSRLDGIENEFKEIQKDFGLDAE